MPEPLNRIRIEVAYPPADQDDSRITRREMIAKTAGLFAFLAVPNIIAACAPMPNTAPATYPNTRPAAPISEYTDDKGGLEKFTKNYLMPVFSQAYAKSDSLQIQQELARQFQELAKIKSPLTANITYAATEEIKQMRIAPNRSPDAPILVAIYLDAIRKAYHAQGFRVEFHAGDGAVKPDIIIHSKFTRRTIKAESLGVNLGDVDIYELPENYTPLFDSRNLMTPPFPRPGGEAYDFYKELYIYNDGANADLAYIQKAVNKEKLNDGQIANTPKAESIRDSARRILEPLFSDGSAKGIDRTSLEAHELAHLIKPPGGADLKETMRNSEKRSFAAQLASTDKSVARLSLATYLIIITQQAAMIKAQNGDYYDAQSNIAGIQAVMEDFVEELEKELEINPTLKTAFGQVPIDKVRKDQDPKPKNSYLPKSNYTDAHTEWLLERVDKLKDADINRINSRIIEKNRNNWQLDKTSQNDKSPYPATSHIEVTGLLKHHDDGKISRRGLVTNPGQLGHSIGIYIRQQG